MSVRVFAMASLSLFTVSPDFSRNDHITPPNSARIVQVLYELLLQATDKDYEQVPIEQFGLAMLRGMGWKDGEGVGKNKK